MTLLNPGSLTAASGGMATVLTPGTGRGRANYFPKNEGSKDRTHGGDGALDKG